MFCEDHRIDYAGENDKTLYLVDSEEKVMLFFYEVILKMTTVVFVKPGSDFRELVDISANDQLVTNEQVHAELMKRKSPHTVLYCSKVAGNLLTFFIGQSLL